VPPGQNGQATFLELLAFQTLGIRPPHSSDTKAVYERLIWNYTGLTDDQIQRFFTDASFGVPADQVESRTTPHPEVTITRDRARGIPHIAGSTRHGTMFGAGYAGAQDRLFLMDVLRNVGRGQLTPFAGGAAGNREFEQQQWRAAPYTEADLQSMIDRLDDDLGAQGAQLQRDLAAYVDGVNAYIGAARAGLYLPGEYTALGRLNGPDPWRATDVVATASLVGGISAAVAAARWRRPSRWSRRRRGTAPTRAVWCGRRSGRRTTPRRRPRCTTARRSRTSTRPRARPARPCRIAAPWPSSRW